MDKEVAISEWTKLLKKMPSLFFGFFLYSTSTLMTFYAGLGMNPWGVFHMGIANYTPLTLGQATQAIGLIILTVSCFMGVVPGLGSVFNMIFIGIFIDAVDGLGILKRPETFIGQIGLLLFGIILVGWASYFYLHVQLGAGPRDGLMEGLVRKLKKPVWMIRGAIECSVLIIGFFLGGPVGIGTIVTAATIGFSVQFAFKVGKYDPRKQEHMNLIELTRALFGSKIRKETLMHHK